MSLKDRKYTIVGLGMLGGSYALAISQKINPLAVYGIDIDDTTRQKAQDKGIITNKKVEDILKDTDILIMSLYPKDTVNFLRENQKNIKSNSIITDVCGVKSSIIPQIRQFLRKDLDYIPAHPMAGNQYRGFDNADVDIFIDKNYIFVPQEDNKRQNLEILKEMALAIGFTHISETDMFTHDKKIAYASHLMHLISVCVTNCETFESSLDRFAGGSFKDLTRISDINPHLWTETFFYNKEFLLEELNLFKQNIDYLQSALENEQYQKVFDFLEKSRVRKSK